MYLHLVEVAMSQKKLGEDELVHGTRNGVLLIGQIARPDYPRCSNLFEMSAIEVSTPDMHRFVAFATCTTLPWFQQLYVSRVSGPCTIWNTDSTKI